MTDPRTRTIVATLRRLVRRLAAFCMATENAPDAMAAEARFLSRLAV